MTEAFPPSDVQLESPPGGGENSLRRAFTLLDEDELREAVGARVTF